MAYGTEQLIGQGLAQVFPRGKGYGELMDNLNQQRQYQFQRERQTKLDQEKKNDELYSLIGNELNPRDFNAVIHYKVKKAQEDLASQIIANPKMDYGQMYLQAHNKAAELGQTSDTLNRLDQQIALTRKEYEGDRRLNMGVAELAARKKILDKIQNGEKLDESVNYIDEALNDPTLQKSLLTDNSNYVNFDLKAHKMDDLTGSVRKRVAGRTTAFNYNVDNIPTYFSVTPGKTEYDEPTVNTKSEIVTDANGNKIPILSEDAYGAIKLQHSNITSLNNIIQEKYGKEIDLRSQQADILRRKEAYDMLEQQKPKVNSKRSELQPITINTGSGSTKNAGANWVNRATAAVQTGDPNKIEEEFSQLIQGDKNKFESVKLENGKVKVVLRPNQRYDMMGKAVEGATDPTLFEDANGGIDVSDKFLPQKLARLWQTVMGSDVQTERKQYEPQQTTQKPAGTGYNIKGKDYTEAELVKMGYSLDDIKPYKKK